jgi:hypothetical protein
MARLKVTPHLTEGHRADIAKAIGKSHAGMAHFADTGPFGATCAMCVHYGCWKQIRNASGEVVQTSRVQEACAKYKELTGKIGPAVPANASACKYFSRKKEEESQN